MDHAIRHDGSDNREPQAEVYAKKAQAMRLRFHSLHQFRRPGRNKVKYPSRSVERRMKAMHSATVNMQLTFPSGRVVSVSQTGPDFLFVREPIEDESRKAKLAITIDGREESKNIEITEIHGNRVNYNTSPEGSTES